MLKGVKGMKRNKIIVLLLMCVLLVMVVAGCGKMKGLSQDEADLSVKTDKETSESEEAYDEQEIRQFIIDGMDYLHGTNGKEYDTKEALKCFETASAAGNSDGSFLAGYVYDWVLESENGQNYTKAIECYKKCMKDNAFAKVCLGRIYYAGGLGVKKDIEKAESLWEEALQEIDEDALLDTKSLFYREQAWLIMGMVYMIKDTEWSKTI